MDLFKLTPTRHHTALSFAKIGLTLLLTVGAAQAQVSRFTYQGRLTDGSAPANGTYDFQFALWDTASGGTQIGSTQAVSSVSVTGGIFTVTLDFGENAFPGGDRFLEIGVRPGGGGAFTTLAPRQQLSSTPYAIRTLNAGAADTLSAACSGCVSDANIGGVAAIKISGTVSSVNGGTGLNAAGASGSFLKSNGSVWTSVPLSPADIPSGSGNYIQNTTTTQAGSNFNISGNGTVGGNFITGSGISNGGFTVDQGNTNSGQVSPGLNLGGGGEGIASKRTGGGNRFGLDLYTNFLARMSITNSGDVGVGTTNPLSKLEVNGGIRVGQNLDVFGFTSISFAMDGGPPVCIGSQSRLAICPPSSLRYKKDLARFSGGLQILNRLKPITFTWKDRPERDLGLAAEDVAAVEPLLTFRNAKGQIEGVKYDKLTVVLINAVKEQQAQIEKQHEQLKQEQLEIEGLKKLVCWRYRKAAACKMILNDRGLRRTSRCSRQW